VFGANVTFTATVSEVIPVLPQQPTGITPTGTVAFSAKIGNGPSTSLGAPVAMVNGVATLDTTTLPLGINTVTATYSGDTGFLASSDFLLQTVTTAASNTTLVSDVPNSAAGQLVTFTATVGPPGATGTVAFTFDKGTASQLTTAAQAVGGGGTATYSTSALTVGTHTVEATYSGDAALLPSTSTPITQTVAVIATTLVLTSDTNPSLALENRTFTATVAALTGPAPSAGAVVFTIDGVATPPVPVANGVAAFSTTTPLTVGSHSVSASYAFTAPWLASSGTLTQVVNQQPTSVGLTSSAPTSTWGDLVTFTADLVTPVGTAGGTVVFNIDGVDQPAATASAGTATYSTSTLGDGSHTVLAKYGGDATHLAANSGSITQTVLQRPTAVTLTSSTGGNAVTYPQTVTFTASVQSVGIATIPTGSVTFHITNVWGNSSETVPLDSTGGATTRSLQLNGGDNTIVAEYVPNSTHWLGNSSPAAGQFVNRYTTTLIHWLRSTGSSVWGQPVSFDLAVGFGAGVPAGKVSFYVNGTTPADLAFTTDISEPFPGAGYGIALWTTEFLPVGTSNVYAIYEGTGNYTHLGWLGFTQTVAASNTSTTVAPIAPFSRTSSTFFTATVAPVAPATALPNGTVRFQVDGGNWSAPVPVDGFGNAYWPLPANYFSRGTHRVRARFTGTIGWWRTSTSPSVTFTVNR
jgi:hypothetical protein